MTNYKTSIIFALLLSLSVGIAVYFWQQTELSTEAEVEETSNLELVDFKFDETGNRYFGKLIVEGYASVEQINDSLCTASCEANKLIFENSEEATCEEQCPFIEDYVSFVVTNTENEAVSHFSDSLGLGCQRENNIYFQDLSDEFNTPDYFNQEVAQKILNSNAENPIKIQLEKYISTDGIGLPVCYSHFSRVSIVE
jgi:hypothetical protein